MRYAALLLLAAAAHAATIKYWVEPCTRPESGCQTGDPQLAVWALKAWQSASNGRLKFKRALNRDDAQVRFFWGGMRGDVYGEARPIEIDGVKQFELHITPPFEDDVLMRDAIVYLTCVHELGHALDLPHTANFDDIMYTFEMGGRSREYFDRYRRLLTTREDIRKHSGLSKGDRKALIRSLK